jgi:hypothetical protein
MPNFRNIYFSFHYEDVVLAEQIRKSGQFADRKGFGDWADQEQVKRYTPEAIRRWIREQMKGSSVTVVLIGAETAAREWVRFEIEESVREKKGLLGIYIDQLTGFQPRHFYPRLPGPNPFARIPARAKEPTLAELNAASVALRQQRINSLATLLSPPSNQNALGGLLSMVGSLPPPPPSGMATLAALAGGMPSPATTLDGFRLGAFPYPPKSIIGGAVTGRSLANQVKCYCWKGAKGHENFDRWVQDAASDVGR